MADPVFTEDELAALFEEAMPARPDSDDELAALLGESPHVTGAPAASVATPPAVTEPVTVATAAPPPTSVSRDQGNYSWLQALHLAPQYQRLILRYPAIGLMQHDQYGLVLVAAYLEDLKQKIRRNLQLGNDMFFHAPELDVFEPDTRKLGCRIIVKTLRHQVGMRIRYWENAPQGDVLGKSGVYEVREAGLKLLTGSKALKR